MPKIIYDIKFLLFFIIIIINTQVIKLYHIIREWEKTRKSIYSQLKTVI